MNAGMREIEKFHINSANKISETNPTFTYAEKMRKKLCQNFLYMTGKNICTQILGWSVSEWSQWFEQNVVYVS